ncbi:unnamed protein product [Dibothriocephalus latus]|uniref:C2 domain-containing protein n=1 Tax=Dibothriocephalus latus TaxID=60516 RepID=A0A3P7LCH2_DIBLA|nr:unnamed protein product [Dibothriocephalus latus]
MSNVSLCTAPHHNLIVYAAVVFQPERPEIFDTIFDIFKIDLAEEERKARLQEVQQSILSGACQWSAKLSITVKSAQGLIGKDKSGRSDPYVTVQVGKVRRRTKTVPQELNPTWDEKFNL